MAADDLAERLQRIEDTLGSISTQVTATSNLDALQSRLDDIDARLARMEDALYPVEPPSDWGPDGGPTVRIPR
jgi:hypothetical protein